MSAFLSDKYMKYRAALIGGEIADDLACRNCGYNVRGLKYGRNCPECGQMIEMRRGLRDVLADGDIHDRQRWRLGFALATGCIATVVAGRVLFFIGQLSGAGGAMVMAYVSAGLVLSVAWTVASWLMTPTSLDATWPRLRPMRRFIRVTQPLWMLAYVLLLLKHFSSWGNPWGPAPPASMVVADLALRTVASVGVLVLAALMSVVAKEAELDTASARLERSIFWIVTFTILLLGMFAIFGGSIPWIMLLFIIPMLVGWSWFLVLMALGYYEMHSHVTWSLRHAADASGRDSRIAAVRGGLEAQAQTIIRPVANPPRPDLLIDPDGGAEHS